jgi:hypothetical protein
VINLYREREFLVMAYSFHFVGGCNDGKVVRTDSSVESERTWAEGFVAMTHDGTVGARVMGLSDAAIETISNRSPAEPSPHAHIYEVADRTVDKEGCVCVRMRYAGVGA